ncbi:hypothetical protein QDY72_02600 [Kingella negevensis]|uniref:PD-(D/E)XK nuclease domain-containing protein n=1 Tax=Kingella negevensis TaxID=1522312 RepID=UPI0025511A77|nr:hypothetical protein [Kingella negevensis]MDK4684082.1 hypothetical protein [Kingella negevensis]MDK4706738.1 hypothetical protein [Kingella negevensis]MDK4708955.1 hypothetical protein [Kingella negevensis]
MAFKQWHRSTTVLIEKCIGKEEANDFSSISYYSHVFGSDNGEYYNQQVYLNGIKSKIVCLKSIIEQVQLFYKDTTEVSKIDNIAILENIFSKFHSVARQLLRRYSDRDTLTINDEYDVQDL